MCDGRSSAAAPCATQCGTKRYRSRRSRTPVRTRGHRQATGAQAPCDSRCRRNRHHQYLSAADECVGRVGSLDSQGTSLDVRVPPQLQLKPLTRRQAPSMPNSCLPSGMAWSTRGRPSTNSCREEPVFDEVQARAPKRAVTQQLEESMQVANRTKLDKENGDGPLSTRSRPRSGECIGAPRHAHQSPRFVGMGRGRDQTTLQQSSLASRDGARLVTNRDWL
jgi:hypothetical protein